MAEQGKDEEDSLYPDGEGDVKSDNAEGATTQPDGFRNHEEVVAHESNVGRLNCCWCRPPPPSQCRHWRRQGRCAVNTIADHADTAKIGSEFSNLFDLLFGQKVTLGFIDTGLCCDCVCGTGVIAAQHYHLANAGIVKKPNSLGRIWANSITDHENAENFAFAIGMRPMAYDDDGFRIGLDLG